MLMSYLIIHITENEHINFSRVRNGPAFIFVLFRLGSLPSWKGHFVPSLPLSILASAPWNT